MAQSERQKKATAGLEAAIVECNDAWLEENPEGTDGVVTDWLVIVAVQKPDMEDQGNDITAYSTLMPGGGIPWYRCMGLLEAGRHYLTHNVGPVNEE